MVNHRLERRRKTNKTRPVLFLFILFFIFFAWLHYFAPLSGDDWTWGTAIGMERLESGFVDYNGRYFSNLLIILLTRFDLLRMFVLALSSTLLIIVIGAVANTNTNTSTNKKHSTLPYLAAFFLIMLVPLPIFKQTFGWTSGYVNYVTSMVLLLAYLLITKNIFKAETPTYSKGATLLVIPLALLTQLIVEHVTLFALVTGATVIIYTYVKFKRLYTLQWAYFITLIIGAAIMFTNGAYMNVILGEDTYDYRTVNDASGSTLTNLYTTYRDTINPAVFFDNKWILAIVSFLLIIILFRTTTGKRWLDNGVRPAILVILISYNLLTLIFQDALGANYLGEITADFEALFSLLFFATWMIVSAFYIEEKATKFRFFYYIAGMIILIAPFLIITPFGPRAVFNAYVLLTLFVIELLQYISKQYDWSLGNIARALFIANGIIALTIGFIFYMNGTTDRERLAQLEEDVSNGEKVIEMRQLPFHQFHWMPSPDEELSHAETFKIYHDVPLDVTFELIPYHRK